MNGADGKPFKTRAGGVMKLYDLIAMATAEAEKRLAEQGIGADYSRRGTRRRSRSRSASPTIKFADLSNHRTTDYIFDLERFSRSKARPGPICNMRRCASSRSCARRESEGQAVGARPPSIRRKSASWFCSFWRCPMPWRRRKKSARPTSCAIMPLPGAEFQPLLCRAPHPVRIGRGAAGGAAGALRPGAGGPDRGPGPSGDRGSRKNVSKSGSFAGASD